MYILDPLLVQNLPGKVFSGPAGTNPTLWGAADYETGDVDLVRSRARPTAPAQIDRWGMGVGQKGGQLCSHCFVYSFRL